MKKSELFDIAIKLFGVSVLIDAAVAFNSMITMFIGQLAHTSNGNSTGQVAVLLAYAVNVSLYIALGYWLLFRTQRITSHIVKVDSENPVIHIDKRTAFGVACVVVGGLLITNSLSTAGYAIIQIIEAVQAKAEPHSYGLLNIGFRITLMFAGYILIAAHDRIANHFTKENAE